MGDNKEQFTLAEMAEYKVSSLHAIHTNFNDRAHILFKIKTIEIIFNFVQTVARNLDNVRALPKISMSVSSAEKCQNIL